MIAINFCLASITNLQAFPDSLSQDVQGWVSLHYFGHCLLNQRLGSREPITKSRVQIIRKINSDLNKKLHISNHVDQNHTKLFLLYQNSCWTRID